MHVIAVQRWASEAAPSSRRRAIATTLVGGVLARLAAPRLDARLAAGEDPLSDDALARRLAVDEPAVEVARPALQQLASALRSRADVEPRRVAITQVLLTEPSSALYRPAHRDELYELARAALLALGSREADGTEPLRR